MRARIPVAEVMVLSPDASALEWSELVQLLANPIGTTWLSSASGKGLVHTTPVGAFFNNDTFYFTSGQGTRKHANLAQNPSCTMALQVAGYDIFAEGAAIITRNEAKVAELAAVAQAAGWPAVAMGSVLEAPFYAPTSGPAPYDVYEMTLRKVFAHGNTEETISHCTRFTF